MNTSHKERKTRKRLGLYDRSRESWFVVSKESHEIKPGIYLFKFCSLFRFGIVMFWLISVAMMLTSCGASSADVETEYKSQTDRLLSASTNVINSTTSVPNPKVQQLWSDRQQKFLFVDFNTEKLCGRLGCAYNLFLSSNEKLDLVWSGYLDPYLPPKVKLLALKPVDEKRQQYPCLAINQLDAVQSANSPQAPVIKEVTLCFSGAKYQIESSRSFHLLGKK
jgi:hypothetical protein